METHYEDAASRKVTGFSAKPPQSQTLYATNRLRAEDSMILVLLKTNPINVRNTRAVSATPRSVDESGEDAAAGYALGTVKKTRSTR